MLKPETSSWALATDDADLSFVTDIACVFESRLCKLVGAYEVEPRHRLTLPDNRTEN
jgi:hypothetical protein